MMFMVFKEKRPAGTRKFGDYEAARQYARKLCRRKSARAFTDTSNPMIGHYGYSVRKVS